MKEGYLLAYEVAEEVEYYQQSVIEWCSRGRARYVEEQARLLSEAGTGDALRMGIFGHTHFGEEPAKLTEWVCANNRGGAGVRFVTYRRAYPSQVRRTWNSTVRMEVRG